MTKDGKNPKEPDRAARLSEALRRNLRRRKQQVRDRDRESDGMREGSPDRRREEGEKT